MNFFDTGFKRPVICAMFCVGMAALLSGCGSSIPEGYWTLTAMTEGDEKVEEDDLEDYGLDDAYISTDDDGSGYVVLFDVPSSFECDEDESVLEFDSGDVSYKISGKKLILEDKNVSMTFKKSKEDAPKKPKNVSAVAYSVAGSGSDSDSGSSSSIASAGSDMADIMSGNSGSGSAAVEFFEGDWYGYWTLNAWDDYWEPYEGDNYDILCEIKMNDDGETGQMILWDAAMPYDSPIAQVDISTRAGLDPNIGGLCSEGGYFLDDELEHADWLIDPGIYDYSDYIQVDAYYYDTKGEMAMSYEIHLKKWGADWSDHDPLPPQYDWYKDLVDKGESMPDNLPE
ncbi:MAG: hypothetical protein IJU43_00655 [Lachnospiraceae bacterium]|nr:hypothetical protein [Lachnospiraceae bacterium]